MVRKGLLVAFIGLVLVPIVSAQGPAAWRFRWVKGQVLTYRVEQATNVTSEVGKDKNDTSSKMNLVKRWQVLDIDAAGVATLQLTLAALRLESTTPTGEKLVFDSAEPEKSNSPEMKSQMQKYVGQPLAVLRVDGRGQVVEVKESKFGPANKYQNEVPFSITLPEKLPETQMWWERAYQIVLDPPQGTGEKYDAVQKHEYKKATGALATITIATGLKATPESKEDQIPLLQYQPQGEVVFDTQAGILRQVRMRVEKEITGHEGEGSRYKFTSSYSEDYVPSP